MNKAVLIGTVVIVAVIVAVFGYQRFVDSRLTPEELNSIRMEKHEQAKAEAKAEAEAEAEAEAGEEEAQEQPKEAESIEEVAARYPDKKLVRFQTTKGDIVIELFPDKAPVTVASFVNLIQRKFYDGLIFHRVIPSFMIQGGCRLGTGSANLGYQFEDEIVEGLEFDRPGLLAMANRENVPGSNGSQFFITHADSRPVHLNGLHTIFGEVLEGQDVVEAIRKGDKMVQLELAGDFSELLESQKDRVAEWNEKLGPVE